MSEPLLRLPADALFLPPEIAMGVAGIMTGAVTAVLLAVEGGLSTASEAALDVVCVFPGVALPPASLSISSDGGLDLAGV